MIEDVVIRADASYLIGSGHVMRCLTLAHMLREEGIKVSFICNKAEGDLSELIIQQGFNVYLNLIDDSKKTDHVVEILKKINCDLLIIDHYQIDIKWEKEIRCNFPNIKIMVIDDLANRKHDCDILLDQNYVKDFTNRYVKLVPKECKQLLGPKYLLLRPEFYKKGTGKQKKDKQVHDILIFYGGSDPTNETDKAINALSDLDTSKIKVHVVTGQSNINKEHIREKCEMNGYYYYLQIDYLADLMRQADLSLGAGGVTMWERCYLGLPTIVTIVEENQRASVVAASQYGAIWNMGWHTEVKENDLSHMLENILKGKEKLGKVKEKARNLMNVNETYVKKPVIEAIMEEKS
ncbi:UDP-2,4-diacetamido-2,4,6-trideoxy-beta-L-altropyranose hydrolase [Niallia sp. FSL W8-0951]|nr:UDP-2,4-diacetamido-2,4,6-trideoxy-beta-L-altropyranose hydrolase [Niallia circulans]